MPLPLPYPQSRVSHVYRLSKTPSPKFSPSYNATTASTTAPARATPACTLPALLVTTTVGFELVDDVVLDLAAAAGVVAASAAVVVDLAAAAGDVAEVTKLPTGVVGVVAAPAPVVVGATAGVVATELAAGAATAAQIWPVTLRTSGGMSALRWEGGGLGRTRNIVRRALGQDTGRSGARDS